MHGVSLILDTWHVQAQHAPCVFVDCDPAGRHRHFPAPRAPRTPSCWQAQHGRQPESGVRGVVEVGYGH